MGDQSLSVSLEPCPALGDLESIWLDLEARSAPNFFLSWTWIGAWLSMVADKPALLKVMNETQCVALGFIAKKDRSLFGKNVPGLYLNQTGVSDEDAVFIEYNNLLVAESHASTGHAAAIHYIAAGQDPLLASWSEVYLSGITQDTLTFLQGLDYTTHVYQTRHAPYRDLSSLGEDGVLPSLSRNTRYQIQRSMKVYQEKGELVLSIAKDFDQSLAWLNAMQDLHQRTWEQRGQSGAFANARFDVFIRTLLKVGMTNRSVELLQIASGEETIGFLVNFLESTRVLNYQSGFSYSDNPHLKPGLVCHTLAMDQYKARGYAFYNFLAGESQYKTSLADHSEPLFWVKLTRPSWALTLEATLKSMKKRVIRDVRAS